MAGCWASMVRRRLLIAAWSAVVAAAMAGGGCGSPDRKEVVVDDRRELPPYESVAVWAKPGDEQSTSTEGTATQPSE